jgi:hypothetical protein
MAEPDQRFQTELDRADAALIEGMFAEDQTGWLAQAERSLPCVVFR